MTLETSELACMVYEVAWKASEMTWKVSEMVYKASDMEGLWRGLGKS